MSQRIGLKTYANCQGCSLCVLPCPMWRQHRDVMFSPQGMAKAMQSGATADDLQEQVVSCIQCGACDVICPEGIDLTAWIANMGRELGKRFPLIEEAKLTGFVISCDPWVQQQIHVDDFYIIDAAPFHADYERRVEHYTSLRTKTGCSMNLDLNRMAIPTGIGSAAEKTDRFDVKKQFEWLISGREFHRILVENTADIEVLSQLTDQSVVCVADLLGSLDNRSEHATG